MACSAFCVYLTEGDLGRFVAVELRWGEKLQLERWAPDGRILPAFEDQRETWRHLDATQQAEVLRLAELWLPRL
jgi:hypothetical protein